MSFPKHAFAFAALALLLSFAARTQDIIGNGTLDAPGPDGAPRGWRFFRSNNDGFQIRAEDGVLTLANPTARSANVYGGASTEIAVTPYQKYTVFLRVKGDNGVRGLGLAIGAGWRIRIPVTDLTSEWQTLAYDFSPEPEDIRDGVATFAILCEDVAPQVAIDDIVIQSAGTLPAAHNTARIVANGKFEQITGQRPADWTFNRSNSPRSELDVIKDSDRNAVRVEHPYPAAPNVYCAVTTTVKLQPDTPYRLRFLARGDAVNGVNIALGKNWSKRFHVRGVTAAWKSYEYDFTLTRDELQSDFTSSLALIVEDASRNALFTDFAITPLLATDTLIAIPETTDPGRIPDGVESLPNRMPGTRAVLLRNQGKIYLTAEFAAPDRFLRLYLPEIDRTVDVGPETGNTVELPAGLDPIFRFALLEFNRDETVTSPVDGDFRIAFSAGVPYAKAFITQLDPGRSVQGKLYVVPAPDDAGKPVAVRTGTGNGEALGGLAADVPLNQFPFYFNLDGYQPFRAVFHDGDRELTTLTVAAADPFDANRHRLEQLAVEVRSRTDRADRLPRERQDNAAVSAPLFLLQKSVADLNPLLPADTAEARQYFNERCDLALDASDALLRQLDAAMTAETLEPTIRRIEPPLTRKHNRPEATVLYSDGERRDQTVFFNGYGHQIDAVNLQENFPRIGANAIQIEIGPEFVFPRAGQKQEFEADYKFFDDYIDRAFRLAAGNGAVINLLIAPHYMPKWYFDRYPEISSHTGWLLEYEVNHPRARALMEAYLDAILPRLAEERYRKVLHGITVSNEPIYYGFQLGKPFCREEFKQYLIDRFGDVAEFNRLTGNNFATFDAAIQTGEANPAIRFEFNRCKRLLFADWHRFLAEKIRAVLPEVAISAKLMPFRAVDSEFTSDGVDIQLYDEIFDYAGQDNGMFYTFGKEKYISDWVHVLLTNEFQYSIGGKSISNTENHPLQDSTKSRIPPENVDAGTMLQYLSGANALITWIWYHRPEYGLAHNISMRPDCVWAQTRAAIDANRLRDEILAFTAPVPEVELLHSETSSILDANAYTPFKQLYELSCVSGIRAGIIGERKLRQNPPEELKVLLVADQNYLDEETLPALKAFTARGGRIVATPGALAFNQYGQPLQLDFPVEFVDRIDTLEQFYHAAGVTPPVKLVSSQPDNHGIFFRTARMENGDSVIALVNFNYNTARIRFDGVGDGALTDLRSGRPAPTEYNLKPLDFQLLKLSR